MPSILNLASLSNTETLELCFFFSIKKSFSSTLLISALLNKIQAYVPSLLAKAESITKL